MSGGAWGRAPRLQRDRRARADRWSLDCHDRNLTRTLWGVGAGLLVLAAISAALRPTLTQVPLGALRVVVGGLLLCFGLRTSTTVPSEQG